VQDGVEWFGEVYTWYISVGGSSGCSNTGLGVPSDRWRLEIWDNRYLSGGTVEQRQAGITVAPR
jgi:hypothetical protein